MFISFSQHGAMFISLKKITISVFLVYCVLTCYTIYLIFIKNSIKSGKIVRRGWSLPDDGEDWNPWGEEFEREHILKESFAVHKHQVKWWNNQSLDFGKQYYHKSKNDATQEPSNIYNVEIWGKAAIGLYLWEHIFGGKLESKMDGMWTYGFKKIDNIKLKFRTGPGVITTKVPMDVQNLILILNGRSHEKIQFSKMWLDYLPQFRLLQTVILIILGDEQCNNDWILPYMSVNGGLVNVTFIVYDSPLVDNVQFYQWPLGVATYRGFPKIDPKQLDLEAPRPYICNFLGTVYPHSSREQLISIMENKNLSQYCFFKTRQEWQLKETKDSLEMYVQSLRLSDLTINPVGMNSECYRIYEAMSFGSVPVVEDVMTPGVCGDSKAIPVSSPFRLLKSMNAPLIYVKSFLELPELIELELKMSLKDKIERRKKIIRWYENFKISIREQLMSVLKKQIFQQKS